MQAEAAPINPEAGQESAPPQDPIWSTPELTLNEDPAEHLPPENNGPAPGQYNIPELEEEDWEEGQFTDANSIDHNNSTHKSSRLRREYSSPFRHLDNQYYSPTNNTPGLDYDLPEPDYYN